MDFVFALLLVFVPVISGLMAKSFGRKFWPWFFVGTFLPLVTNVILLCLPDKTKKKPMNLKAVENDEIFDHLFISKRSKKINDHEGPFSATA